jgi:hypothetical protein
MSAPLFVASPTTRSGTTLLQRLITSSDNGICYGEFAGRRIAELCDFAHKELLLVQKNEDRQAIEWDNVLNGNVDYWMVGLDLPGDFAKHALVGAVQFYKQHYDEATSMVNKEIWAVKFPMLEFTRVARIADLISDLKCIYIYRNVFDVIRSQKSKGWISTRQNVIESCLEWVKNTDVVAALKKNDFQNQPAMLHVVQYEDLVLNLDSNLKAIEAFTGLRGIRPEVADTKVNTWITASKEDMAPAVSYREPEPLSPEDVETIRTICASRMDELYPDFEAAPA